MQDNKMPFLWEVTPITIKQIRKSIENQFYNQEVWYQIKDQVLSQVYVQVEDQVWFHVYVQVWDQVIAEIDEEIQ